VSCVPSVIVAGATGFTGALAAALLWEHPDFDLVAVTGRSDIGRPLEDIHPRHRVPLRIEELDYDIHGEASAAIVAYPHGASAPVVAALRARGVRVVDLSADFRLHDQRTYEDWYGEHGSPSLLAEAVYGLPELHRDRIAGADLVANPGCYPTGALLALAPLARAGLIDDVVIDAKEGVSGAGRTPSERTHFSTAGENVFAYGVASHRHTPEIEQELALLGHARPVSFTPHLMPFDQGELTSAYVTPTRSVDTPELRELFERDYAGEPFIELALGPPGVREVRDTNRCRIFTLADGHSGKLLVFAAIDNLWKGAASQAVQNLNLMFGLDETRGLR
jgi:N-acetyl-gamma-glutamyl-phosphate reductase